MTELCYIRKMCYFLKEYFCLPESAIVSLNFSGAVFESTALPWTGIEDLYSSIETEIMKQSGKGVMSPSLFRAEKKKGYGHEKKSVEIMTFSSID